MKETITFSKVNPNLAQLLSGHSLVAVSLDFCNNILLELEDGEVKIQNVKLLTMTTCPVEGPITFSSIHVSDGVYGKKVTLTYTGVVLVGIVKKRLSVNQPQFHMRFKAL